MTLRQVCATQVLIGFFLSRAWAESPASQPTRWPFYVLENGVKDEVHATPDSQARMLKGLGYDGMGQNGVAGLAERVGGTVESVQTAAVSSVGV